MPAQTGGTFTVLLPKLDSHQSVVVLMIIIVYQTVKHHRNVLRQSTEHGRGICSGRAAAPIVRRAVCVAGAGQREGAGRGL